MRTVHRLVAVLAVLFGLYVGATGSLIQLIDLQALLRHAPASDPNMQAIRDGHDGPPNFRVLVETDYDAVPLPADLDFDSALATIMKSARTAVPDAAIRFLELRMVDGEPVGQIAAGGRLLRFDALSGAVLVAPGAAPPVTLPLQSQPSLRNSVKNIHRLTAYGDYATLLDLLMGLALCTMIFTGLFLYFRLLKVRTKIARPSPFWSAGGGWRTLHRAVAIAASLFLIVVALSGTVLSIGDVGVAYYRVVHHGKRPGLTADVSSPLTDLELPAMLHATLTGFHQAMADAPVKVLRLRYFAGMPQGIIVAGGKGTRQLAFNAASGREASEYEPFYPVTGQPFGWQEDQIVKQIHRGDFIGLTGRGMNLVAGLSMLFLSLSGAVMYIEMWYRRRRAGRPNLFWR